jgi:secreted trypsin-like serine protease
VKLGRVLSLLAGATICAAAGWPGSALAASRPTRIVGGTATAPDTAPWTAFLIAPGALSVAAPGSALCGAAVVSPTAVVTAAHCVVGNHGLRTVEVVTGRNALSGEDGQRVPAGPIDVDPAYSPKRLVHDMAVVHLSAPTAAPPVAVATAGQARLAAPGAKLLLTGWGTVRNNDFAIPDGLRQATITAAPNRRCRAVYGRGFDGKAELCSVPGRPAPCHGDSGSPLVSLASGIPTLVGVVSFGGEWCGTRGIPSVYTRVSSEAGFLTRSIG